MKRTSPRAPRRLGGPLAALLILSLTACAAGPDTRRTSERARPNIVIIMADDLGFSDIGAYGGEIDTPNLDRLAADGLRYTQFYNAARCCPSRASLLTGLYPHQAGMGGMVSSVTSDPAPGPYQGYLNDQSVTMAEVLRTAGYQTYMSGKWHVGEKAAHWPRTRGFGRYWGLISGASSYFELVEEPLTRQIVLDDALWTPPADGFYMTDTTTDYAVEFLREHESSYPGQPFLLYVSYTAPHWPLHALPEDVAKYLDRYHGGWDALREERYARLVESGIIGPDYALSPRTPGIPAWEAAQHKPDWARRMAVYAAMVDRMDQGIGRLVDRLRDTGALHDTLILFLSDNGASAENIDGRRLHQEGATIGERGSYAAYDEPWANASNAPFRLYKSRMHEGGIATPLIAHWPGGISDPGRITNQVGHINDLMATSLELAGVAYPETVDGRRIIPLEGQSLVRSFLGSSDAARDVLFWEHEGNGAVRRGQWKLVRLRDGPWELYDMEADRTELNDLSGAHPDVVRELDALWQGWASRVGARVPGQQH